jgi:hypothetical protein
MTNDRVYIHEFIDIRGTHRANYMHHMLANWSPSAQEDRGQQCFGVWAVLGTTGQWPQVCNIWEEPGFDGLAASFEGEAVGPAMQDPKLAKWWQAASEFRRGGFDRVLVPAPEMPTIGEHLAAGERATVFAHETLRCAPGTAPGVLELAGEAAVEAYRPLGWRLVGAWRTAMRDDDEVILLWAIPDWPAWAAGEQAQSEPAVAAWRAQARTHVVDWHRILLVAAELCPWRIGRQPARSDRTDWEEL